MKISPGRDGDFPFMELVLQQKLSKEEFVSINIVRHFEHVYFLPNVVVCDG